MKKVPCLEVESLVDFCTNLTPFFDGLYFAWLRPLRYSHCYQHLKFKIGRRTNCGCEFPTFFREAVFLQAAVGFVGNGAFYEGRLQGGLKVASHRAHFFLPIPDKLFSTFLNFRQLVILQMTPAEPLFMRFAKGKAGKKKTSG